ncbi:IL1FA protein, partial [Origma solitaria]|nr:IL1FA protein [Origma solitaria]
EFTVASGGPRPAPQPYHYVLRDTEQKGLCLQDGHLVATSLQGANAAQEEPISVVPNRHLERHRCPLMLGIRGGTRALALSQHCPRAVSALSPPDRVPALSPRCPPTMAVSHGCPRAVPQDVGLLELFAGDKDTATPFTFYKAFGGSTHTFEAAAHPGLFLSTAPAPGGPLRLAEPPSATAFYLRRK